MTATERRERREARRRLRRGSVPPRPAGPPLPPVEDLSGDIVAEAADLARDFAAYAR